MLHIQLERHIAVDGGKPEAVLRGLLAVLQLGTGALFDTLVVDVRVHALERAEIVQQLHGGLFTDTGHARNVVRRIAHERLEVDQANRVEAVFLTESGGVVGLIGGLSHAGGDQHNGRAAADQLQAVPVTGYDHAGVAVLVRAAADGAEQVVGLVARLFAAGNAQGIEHLLCQRQLCGQLIRHALAGCLVGGEFKVTEGFLLHVKADDGAVGLLLVLQFEQRSQKAVNRVGGQSLVVGQLPDAVERAVQYAVAVYHHDFHVYFPRSLIHYI